MTFAIPALDALYRRVMGDFRSYANLDASLPTNNVRPVAKVLAGVAQMILGHLDAVANARFVRTSDEEWLAEHAYQFGVPRLPAARASGAVAVVSTGDIVVPAGTLFTRGDGLQYASTAAGSLAAAGTLQIAVVAQSSGPVANLEAGASLAIGGGVSGSGAASATASVAGAGVAYGADVEDVEDWRARILFRLRNPPHGGAPSDYVGWAKATPGVTRVYVERLYRGPGTVRVFPIFDDLFWSSGGVATSPYVIAVAEQIAALAPATALVTVSAPAPYPISVVATGVAPFTAAVREAIVAELRDAILRLGRVSGDDTPHAAMDFLATPLVFSRSWIWQAVANAVGEERHALVSPAADVVIPAGSMPVLGSVTLSG